MSQLNRYEFVGSFLRPERLKEARKNGLKKKYVKHFKNASIAKKYILSIIKPSDNVLIKASNAINLSELVNYLKESEIDN